MGAVPLHCPSADSRGKTRHGIAYSLREHPAPLADQLPLSTVSSFTGFALIQQSWLVEGLHVHGREIEPILFGQRSRDHADVFPVFPHQTHPPAVPLQKPGLHRMLSIVTRPCPCGYWGNSGEIAARHCRCTFRQIENYRQRISCPLLDRIDLHVEVPIVDFRELASDTNVGEKSEVIRQRVSEARKIQTDRFRKASNSTNSAMGSKLVRQHCKLDREAAGYLEHAMEEMSFSARAHDRILKVARTLADLSGAPDIRSHDILEAIQYRSLDRKLFT